MWAKRKETVIAALAIRMATSIRKRLFPSASTMKALNIACIAVANIKGGEKSEDVLKPLEELLDMEMERRVTPESAGGVLEVHPCSRGR